MIDTVHYLGEQPILRWRWINCLHIQIASCYLFDNFALFDVNFVATNFFVFVHFPLSISPFKGNQCLRLHIADLTFFKSEHLC